MRLRYPFTDSFLKGKILMDESTKIFLSLFIVVWSVLFLLVTGLNFLVFYEEEC